MTLLLKQLDPELELIYKKRPPVRVKIFVIKRYHRQKRFELSLKLVGQVPQLDSPTEEQDNWVDERMRGCARSWERWDA